MSRHTQLENHLTELGGYVDWPEADVTTQVRNRITAPSTETGGIRMRWKVAVAALAALVAVTAVPAGRQAVADLLSVAGIEITFADREPAPGTDPIDMGEAITLAEAASQVDFPVAVPASTAYSEPDGVYFEEGPPAVVHLTWNSGPELPAITGTDLGLLITQFASPIEGSVLKKGLTSETEVVATSVDGHEALWLEGAPHELTYDTTRGLAPRPVSRLAANVLLWEDDGVTYRLESGLELSEAMPIAESLTTYVP